MRPIFSLYRIFLRPARLFAWVTLILGLAGATADAHTPAEGDIWATVGPYWYRTNTNNVTSAEASGWGGMISAEGDVDYNGGVVISMLYLDQLYARRIDGQLLAEHIKRMHITTGYRHWFYHWLGAELAFFSAYSMGDPKVLRDERSAGSDDERTTAREITEYGFDAAVQWEVWRFGDIATSLEARYSWSLSRQPHEDIDTYGVLFGCKYLVPKRG